MFTTWKIPDRLTTGGSRGSSGRSPDDVTKQSPPQTGLRRSKTDSRSPDDVTKQSPPQTGLRRSKTDIPQLSGNFKSRTSPPRTARDATTARRESRETLARSGSQAERINVTPAKEPLLVENKQLQFKKAIGDYYKPAELTTPRDFLDQATDPRSYAIMKALKAPVGEKAPTTMRRAESTATRRNTTNLHRSDKQTALDFFQSLVDSNTLGDTDEQRDKIQTLVNQLKHGKGPREKDIVRGVHAQSADEGRLRHLRLLTPHTRGSRWMHQSWHHLPKYVDDNPVLNESAIYTRPHKPTPLHYVIHPDWG